MSSLIRIPLVATALALLGACTSTTFISSWKAPGVGPVTPVGHVIAAVYVSPDEAKRRAGEDALVADLNARGARGIASYTILPDGQNTDVNAAREKLKAAGATGAVVMRVVSTDQQITYTPGSVNTYPSYYNQFGPYWNYGWRTSYDPGYLRTDTVVSVETLVYSLTQDKLVWAGTSKTTNPSNLDKFVTEVADGAAKEMKKDGMLTP